MQNIARYLSSVYCLGYSSSYPQYVMVSTELATVAKYSSLIMIIGDELLITISSPLCTDNKITLTCNVENASQIPFHYQWSVDGVTKVGGPTYTMQAVLPQLVVVTCEVFARKDDNATIQHGRNSVTILPNGNGKHAKQ